jgi:hypothetical protein
VDSRIVLAPPDLALNNLEQFLSCGGFALKRQPFSYPFRSPLGNLLRRNQRPNDLVGCLKGVHSFSIGKDPALSGSIPFAKSVNQTEVVQLKEVALGNVEPPRGLCTPVPVLSGCRDFPSGARAKVFGERDEDLQGKLDSICREACGQVDVAVAKEVPRLQKRFGRSDEVCLEV